MLVFGIRKISQVQFFILTLLLYSQSVYSFQTEALILTGSNLTINDIVNVARKGQPIKIDGNAAIRVEKSHQLLLLATEKNLPIYGLNRGVGLNKDKTIFHGSILSSEAKKLSEQFNLKNLHATSASVGHIAPIDEVRAAMLVRLNTLLLGHAGVQPAVIDRFAAFLNKGITPLFPSGGTIGEGDITLLAQIGLAMIGEGEVLYLNKKMRASEALKLAGLQPLNLYAKDALALFSSNAYAAAAGALTVFDLRKLLDKYDLLTALSLEGLNGNIAPFMEPVQKLRPYSGQQKSAKNVLKNLTGSYLFSLSPTRALQDPLSFRTESQVNGAARDVLDILEKNLYLQINSSDDNPAVILDIIPDANSSAQEKIYYISDNQLTGAVIPTANFDPIPWVLNFQELNIALSHLSASSTQRTIKLSTPRFTHLSRFLSPNQTTIAFGAIQKPLIYLNDSIQELGKSIQAVNYPVAGEIEDVATNSLLAIEKTKQILTNLYAVMGIELMHASQAIDLRKIKDPQLSLGANTLQLFLEFRKQVPFLNEDRILTPDIEKASTFIRNYEPIIP
ncbi:MULTISPECIES: HAL/PAL/TAL family ammonia-lyase [Legionella]|uniref:Histidine ammonia-lyase (Histidase) n=1 Tax=Legionella maceachernii TaxID=466 RepID=A0A0W0WDX4_9GAMM|nr:aromatic amino acid ammonia-lyase [Legionella maceachernii]KTD30508.1 histidine ammonia-lyase (Histidase) [Legionella maceachernii]SKA16845.1 histidine ammonia-lyase [Legionella maceachernii]SUP01722.1 Histidine ammonia-lyase [Legionella maceachernii]